MALSRAMRSVARRSFALAVLSAVFTLGAIGAAQDRPRRASPRREAPARSEHGAREHAAESGASAEPDAPGTGAGAEAESEVVERGGEKVKAIRFTGLDVSGRLKSPQLLYFLNRMKAEFDRPRLPHRSFMPELERSSHGKSF